MNITISYLNTAIILFNIFVGILIPVFLFVFLRKKFHCEPKAFWIGCAVFIVFAVILENIVNNSILNSSMGKMITHNIFTYGIYSGLIASLFEDMGRYIIFKKALCKYNENDRNCLMYAAGHGGFEMFIFLVLPMINYAMYAITINSGNIQTLFDGLSDQQVSTLTETLTRLAATSSDAFIMAPLQRIAAMAVQASMSALIWYAAKYSNRTYLLISAVLMHTAINALSIILDRYGIALSLSVLILCVIAAFYVLFTMRICKKVAEISEK